MNITVLTYSRNGKPNHWESLCRHGINVVEQRVRQPLKVNGSGAVGALLIDREEIAPREASRMIAEAHAQRLCVMVVCDSTELIDGYLQAGADAVISAIGSPAQTANAIRSACHYYLARQELCRQIETLKNKLEHRKLIGHAIGIAGELFEIPEAEALRRLRHQARNQRRPLHEVAQGVIDASRLINGSARTRLRPDVPTSMSRGRQSCATAAEAQP